MKFETSLQINRPVEEVFSLFINPDLMPRWITNLREIEPVRGERGKVGSQYRQVLVEAGQTIEVMQEILAVEENRRLEARYSNKDMESYMIITFGNQDGTTLLEMSADTSFKTMKAKMMAPILAPLIQKRQREDLGRFKQLAEAS